MKIRKHAVEGLLELFSAEPYIFKPAELYKLDEEISKILVNHNIYLVSTRNRISFDQPSLKISKCSNELTGNFLVHNKFTIDTRPFKFKLPYDEKVLQIYEVEYPFNVLCLKLASYKTPQYIRLQDVITHSDHKLDEFVNLKIEYIGQSFGKNGSSNAIKRLIGRTGKQGHGSLQKVLADINNDYPDQEVLILLYDFLEYKNFIYAGGIVQPTFSFESNENRLFDLLEAKYTRKNRIDLVEASLIRYFKPVYNDTYKKSFPKETHEMLNSLFEMDVTGLATSISTADHKIKVYSDSIDPEEMHCAKYSILNESDRASILDLSIK